MAYTVVGQGMHSDGSVYDMLQADFSPTDQKLSGSKWRECALCSFVDRESNMSRIGGRYYCNKNGCSQEKSVTDGSKR
jgi:hypothetical protein